MHIAVGEARDTEIEDLGLAALVDNDVAGFQIAMNDAAFVGVLYGITDFRCQFQLLTNAQTMLACICVERFAMNQLHRKERLLPEAGVEHAGVVNLCDARMLQTCQRFRLLLEAPH